jgi:hypothetical protein
MVSGSAILPAGVAEPIKSSTGAADRRRDCDRRDVIRRVQADYREMPGLSVTLKQGCRLWSLSPASCVSVLDQLIAKGTLKRRGEQYSLR